MKKVIYLAGPIAGLTKQEGTAWRDVVADDLREMHLTETLLVSHLYGVNQCNRV